MIEINQFKDYPEGSPGKKLYEKYNLPVEVWINKYYDNPDLTGWNLLLEWAENAFNNTEAFRDRWCKGRITPYNFKSLDETYSKLSKMNLFTDDINKFISFMSGEGFFEKYETSLEVWLFAGNWANPNDNSENLPALIEFVKMKNGMSFIKSSLADLDFWKLI